MGSSLIRAQDIVELQLQINGHIDALNRREIEGRSDGGAFGAGTVVAADIDNQCVIEFTQFFNGLNHPANLMVGIANVSAEYFRLVGIDLLLQGVECLPLREGIRPRSKL